MIIPKLKNCHAILVCTSREEKRKGNKSQRRVVYNFLSGELSVKKVELGNWENGRDVQFASLEISKPDKNPNGTVD